MSNFMSSNIKDFTLGVNHTKTKFNNNKHLDKSICKNELSCVLPTNTQKIISPVSKPAHKPAPKPAPKPVLTTSPKPFSKPIYKSISVSPKLVPTQVLTKKTKSESSKSVSNPLLFNNLVDNKYAPVYTQLIQTKSVKNNMRNKVKTALGKVFNTVLQLPNNAKLYDVSMIPKNTQLPINDLVNRLAGESQNVVNSFLVKALTKYNDKLKIKLNKTDLSDKNKVHSLVNSYAKKVVYILVQTLTESRHRMIRALLTLPMSSQPDFVKMIHSQSKNAFNQIIKNVHASLASPNTSDKVKASLTATTAVLLAKKVVSSKKSSSNKTTHTKQTNIITPKTSPKSDSSKSVSSKSVSPKSVSNNYVKPEIAKQIKLNTNQTNIITPKTSSKSVSNNYVNPKTVKPKNVKPETFKPITSPKTVSSSKSVSVVSSSIKTDVNKDPSLMAKKLSKKYTLSTYGVKINRSRLELILTVVISAIQTMISQINTIPGPLPHKYNQFVKRLTTFLQNEQKIMSLVSKVTDNEQFMELLTIEGFDNSSNDKLNNIIQENLLETFANDTVNNMENMYSKKSDNTMNVVMYLLLIVSLYLVYKQYYDKSI